MARAPEHFAGSARAACQQLGFSQEELAHELGVSFATIDRCENTRTVPFKLAQGQLEAFCERMKE